MSKHVGGLIILAAFFISLAFVLSPFIASIYDIWLAELRFTQLIDPDDLVRGQFHCIASPSLINDENTLRLEEARSLLRKASDKSLELARIYLLKGRLECFAGNWEQAVLAYQEYIKLDPNDLLGRIELGLALVQYCSNGGETLCNDPILQEEIIELWRRSGVHAETLYRNSLQDFANGNTLAGKRWYISFLVFDTSSQFPENSVKNEAISLLDNLRWLSMEDSKIGFGDVLRRTNDNNVTLWWAGEVGTLVNVEHAGSYLIKISLLDQPPGLLKTEIALDGHTILQTTLDAGNNSWKDIDVEEILSLGPHLISIRFLEDAGDLIISKFSIQALTP